MHFLKGQDNIIGKCLEERSSKEHPEANNHCGEAPVFAQYFQASFNDSVHKNLEINIIVRTQGTQEKLPGRKN